MATATLLLPERKRLSGQALTEHVACALGRSHRTVPAEAGERAQLLRHFELLPRGWPVAALTRSLDSDDAGLSAWLRADPAYVRPDITGAQLLACGDSLQLDQVDIDALLPALRPLFGDSGVVLDAPTPGRWYLRLPREARLPQFTSPADALGTNLLEQLPDADAAPNPEDRRWRSLLNEAQIVLHNHTHNAVRISAGKAPINSLWLWGAGILPDHVTSRVKMVHADDALLRALGLSAGIRVETAAACFSTCDDDTMFDLRGLRDPHSLCANWLQPALSALQTGKLARLWLDCEDGAGFVLERRQRWRFWRKPMPTLDA